MLVRRCNSWLRTLWSTLDQGLSLSWSLKTNLQFQFSNTELSEHKHYVMESSSRSWTCLAHTLLVHSWCSICSPNVWVNTSRCCWKCAYMYIQHSGNITHGIHAWLQQDLGIGDVYFNFATSNWSLLWSWIMEDLSKVCLSRSISELDNSALEAGTAIQWLAGMPELSSGFCNDWSAFRPWPHR